MFQSNTLRGDQIAIYIRWSTDEQTSGTTLETQRESCLHYALSQGWSVPAENLFIDEGHSGATLNRPAMERLRQGVKSGAIKCAIIYKIDRLSRNIVDATQLVLREWDGACYLKCVTEPVDTTNDTGRMFFGILAMFADFERSQIAARTFSGHIRRAEEGRNPGMGLPYGYHYGPNGSATVDEAEAVVVRRIFDAYSRGMGLKQISVDLDSQGVLTREGCRWGKSTLSRIIRNRAYIGDLVYGARRSGKAEGEATRVYRKEPLVVRQNALPVLVDRHIWDSCQAERKDRTTWMQKSGRALGSPWLLTGVAKCRCGRPFISKTDRLGKPFYVCANRRDFGKATCSCGWIPHQVAHEAVISKLQELNRTEVKQLLAEQERIAVQQQIDSLRVLLAQAEIALRNLDSQEARITADYRRGELPAPAYAKLLGDIEKERIRQAEGMQPLRRELQQAENQQVEHSHLIGSIERIGQWDELNISEQRQLLRILASDLTMFTDSGKSPKPLYISMKVRGADPRDAL